LAEAERAGGEIAKPAQRQGGGYFGYVADPDGDLWKVVPGGGEHHAPNSRPRCRLSFAARAREVMGVFMPGNQDDTLHEVTEVAVIRHPDLGVLLLHSTDRRWHFPDSTVRVGQPWDESLRRAVRSATGIEDLTIGPVLLIEPPAST
jgi:hypothetical protein